MLAGGKPGLRVRLQIVTFVLCFGGVVFFTSGLNPTYGLRINRTTSLPNIVFLSRNNFQSVSKGDYVCFFHEHSPAPLVKEVIGTEGDEIEVDGSSVYVNGEWVCDILGEHTEMLGQLKPIQSTVVPHGHLYLQGQSVDSFDSRYEQFGLIPVEQIEEVLWPLF